MEKVNKIDEETFYSRVDNASDDEEDDDNNINIYEEVVIFNLVYSKLILIRLNKNY